MFLTPDDQHPFFAGTYFPNEDRHGLPAFRRLLEQIEGSLPRARRCDPEQNRSLMDALSRLAPAGGGEIPDLAPGEARAQLAGSFDARTAASGRRPSSRIARTWSSCSATMPHQGGRQAGREALHMAVFTLERMIRGGLNDQLGGGFCRYSVDGQWMIPHFEKMLYDNGPLLALCCDAWQITGDPLFRDAAVATADWVVREMQSPQGGYYSTLDADSEGEEGKFYVWDRDEVRGPAGRRAVCPFRRPATGWTGRRISRASGTCTAYRRLGSGEGLGVAREEVGKLLDAAKARLLVVREGRVRPGRDEKVLTAWNGLMIKGMARAARILDRPDYLESAEHAWTSSAPPCGGTGACSPPTRTARPTSTPTWTTMRT